MDLQEASTLAGIALGFSGTIAGLWYAGRQVSRLVIVGNRILVIANEWDKFAERLTRVELHTNTLWEFALRRGAAEAIQKGVATVNSPVRLRAEAIEWMAALAIPLREAYETRWKGLDDIGLCVAIENEFGAQITVEVCIPHQVTNAACLLIACAVAKGETFVSGPAAF
jgi:hypothetical protein